MYFKQLDLTHFRNYTHARLSDLEAGFVLLTGPNGAGKTNILEALSLFTAGKGLRSATLEDLCQRHKSGGYEPFALAARMIDDDAAIRKLGTGLDAATGKRLLRRDGQVVKSLTAFAHDVPCLWLTPQMDRILTDPPGARRKLLDRFVFTIDAAHGTRVRTYERLMAERAKILRQQGNNSRTANWLEAIELQMAETAVSVCAGRAAGVDLLNRAAADAKSLQPFPPLGLELVGEIEDLLANAPALHAEKQLAVKLQEARARDASQGGASLGPHKTDMQVFDKARNMPADSCSTGEQKALLITFILAQARLLAAETGRKPILLLDEIVTHLDPVRRSALFSYLAQAGGQIWLTGTETAPYQELLSQARHHEIMDGRIDGSPV